MNKPLRIIVSGAISIVICYFTYSIFNSVRYRYRIDMYNYKPYFWVFKDSIKSDIDTNLFVSCIRKTDAFYHYIYKHKYSVSIWDFKDMRTAELEKTLINQNVNLDNVKFKSGEVLNKRSSPEITVSFGPFFKYTLDINLDENSKIEKSFETISYKGFYGTVKKLSFTNENGKHLILFDYKVKEFCLVMLYKSSTGFYFIMINSETPFDESIINILNLYPR